MNDKMTKKVVLSQVVEDLQSGLSRWKKDDIGFGSLEKKYNLTLQECIELFNHPKIKNVESKIPTFVIVDDIADEQQEELPVTQPVLETKVQVQEAVVKHVEAPRPAQQATVIVQKTETVEEPVLVPFI